MVHDDKGLVVIAIFGMPPAAPHPNDPARAAHTALDLHARLAAAGIGASVGVTTGPAFSGFVGSRRRREMCAMGSTVNMAARLMAAADGGVLVDAATRDRSALTVRYAARPPLVVKGRDDPVAVWAPVGPRGEADALAEAAEMGAAEVGATGGLDAAVVAHLAGLLRCDNCGAAHVRAVCRRLAEGGHVALRPAGGGKLIAVVTAAGALAGTFDGLTSAQALSRGRLEGLRPYPPAHALVLAKMACLLAHCGLFRLDLVRAVYIGACPSFAPLFDDALGSLTALGLFRLANAADVATALGGGGHSPAPGVGEARSLWGWASGALRCHVHALLLGFGSLPSTRGCCCGSVCRLATSSAAPLAPTGTCLSSAFQTFFKGPEDGGGALSADASDDGH